jgi:RNA-directed DNA polymerase
MLDHIPTDKAMLRKWLKAGYIDQGQLFPTEAGTPQGGIISPTVANLTLDGLEEKLAEQFGQRNSKHAWKNQVNLVRYADGTPVQA